MGAEEAARDVIEYASQIGRLDFLSSVLAVLALILALAAFPLFFFVQHRAKTIAEKEAKEALKDAARRVEDLAISKMETLLPTLIGEYMELVKNSVSSEQANEIAEVTAKEVVSDDDDKRRKEGAE
ncbi:MULTISPECIES: hypothetical protein [Chelativorans]|jgi:hypothetical protein|nr:MULTISPECIES: hypothetical protein [Chelativorans]